MVLFYEVGVLGILEVGKAMDYHWLMGDYFWLSVISFINFMRSLQARSNYVYLGKKEVFCPFISRFCSAILHLFEGQSLHNHCLYLLGIPTGFSY